jgi:choice-of-anchor B domain-containing protein
MSMNHFARSLVVASSLALLAAASAFGHADDPKARDRTPPYQGPGWLRGAGTGGPGGGFTFDNVELAAWLSLDDLGGGPSANDCWGYVSPAGREYAIIGLECGTGFVDITDPGLPVIVEVIPGPCCVWRDIKTRGHYAYVVSECGLGIQVIDLARIDDGIVTHIHNITSVGTASHTVSLDVASGYLYRCGGSGYGLAMYDLNASPSTPVLVGQWPTRYVHAAQVVTYATGKYAGRQIAFCCGGDNYGWTDPSLDIVDVTVKNNPVVLSSFQYPNAAYSHQGWLSEDRQYFYLGDELDEEDSSLPSTTYVIDVSDLEHPFLESTFTNGLPSVTHNLYVRGNLIFEANYTSGVRVFDATDPSAPVEVAWFDTRPEGNEVSFAGLWAPYPYFPSGTFIGSDRQRGLFVWELNLDGPAGDLDGDGHVTFTDLLALLSQWGDCPDPPDECPGDLDASGSVGFSDLLTLLSNWG